MKVQVEESFLPILKVEFCIRIDLVVLLGQLIDPFIVMYQFEFIRKSP
jgi:hypothetical protein